jgi:uncharacterized protein
MPFSLYSVTVPAFQQTLGAVRGLLDKAEAFCTEKKLAPAELIQARLAPDMLPFAYQVKSTVVHSVGALEGAKAGTFSPDLTPPPETFLGLKEKIDGALAALAGVSAPEVERLMGQDATFVFKENRLPFRAEDFLLSFSLPNFYFHASTAYDILRWKGVQIGKRDFMGRLRLKV